MRLHICSSRVLRQGLMKVPCQLPTSKRAQSVDQQEDTQQETNSPVTTPSHPKIPQWQRRYALPEEGNDTGVGHHDEPQRTKKWAMVRREDEKGCGDGGQLLYPFISNHETGTSTGRSAFLLPSIGIDHCRLSVDHIRNLTRSKG